jgi:AcrR family transcriptional regulator
MVKEATMDEAPTARPYRHGNLPNALRAAARAILDEAGPDAVGLRETARRVGVSATAAYRHFSSKEDLLASVAAEGFRELTAAMEAAANGPDPLIALGLAYVEFALQKKGLFRLMFGPVLVERAKYPTLNEAANAAFHLVQRVASGVEGGRQEDSAASMRAWGLVHGLSALFIDDLVPEARARVLAEEILHSGAQPQHRPAA